jgi:hypothetical protein
LILCLCCFSCGDRETPKTVESASTPPPVTEAPVSSGNSDFDQFLDRFNKDSAFQVSHIQYPLKFQQYDHDRAKTIVVAVPKESMQLMDFSKTNPSEWTQQVASATGGNKAIIQIRGVANGMIIDYYFEKMNDQWFLVMIDDQST